MVDFDPRPTGSCLYMINPSGYTLGFIIYQIKHERVYVSYKFGRDFNNFRGIVMICITSCGILIIFTTFYKHDLSKKVLSNNNINAQLFYELLDKHRDTHCIT